jgi:hypothetical protein
MHVTADVEMVISTPGHANQRRSGEGEGEAQNPKRRREGKKRRKERKEGARAGGVVCFACLLPVPSVLFLFPLLSLLRFSPLDLPTVVRPSFLPSLDFSGYKLQSVADKIVAASYSMNFDQKHTSKLSLERY